jgi:hypothetical protein
MAGRRGEICVTKQTTDLANAIALGSSSTPELKGETPKGLSGWLA